MRVLVSVIALAAACAACSGGKTEEQLLSAAQGHLDQGDTASATIELKNLLDTRPDSVQARYLLARVLLREGDLPGAEVELRKAVELGLSAALQARIQGKLWNAQGRFSATVQEYEGAQFDDAALASDVQVDLATAQVGLRRFDLAQAHVQQALKRSPGHLGAQLVAARIEAAQGRREAALAAVEPLIAGHPQSPEPWKLKGDLLRAVPASAAEARAAYGKAVALDARHADALSALIEVEFEAGDAKAAQQHLAQLKKLGIKRPEILLYESQAAASQGQYDRAQELLETLLKSNANDVRLLQAAGAVALAAGKRPEAEAYLGKALRAKPDAVEPRLLLAQMQLDQSNWHQALRLLEPALEASPPNARALALAARAHEALGDGAQSAADLGRAAQLRPTDAGLRAQAAVAAGLATKGERLDYDKLAELAKLDKSTQSDVKLIEGLMARQLYPNALAAIDALEKKAAGSVVPPTLRGRVLALQGQREAARKAYGDALARDKTHFPAIAGLAALDLQERKPDAARARFDALLQADAASAQALLTLADIERMAGVPAAKVGERIASAIRVEPTSVEARLSLIEHHMRNGDAPAALEAAQAANAAVANSVPLLERQGEVQLMLGRFDAARTSFTTLLNLDAKHLRARLGLAEATLAMGDKAGAAGAVQRALRDHPDSFDALRLAINLALASRELDQAASFAKRMQSLRPTDAVGFLAGGQVELLRGASAPAALAFKRALELNESVDAAAGLHRALVAGKREAEAQAVLQAWQAKHPNDSSLALKAAEAQIATRDFAGAERTYRGILQAQPGHAVALNNLAMVLLEQRKPGAVEFAQKAVSASPEQTDFSDTLARAFASEKSYAKAIEIQRKVVDRAPNVPDYRLSLAEYYLAAQDRAHAKQELAVLQKLGTGFRRHAEVDKLAKAADS